VNFFANFLNILLGVLELAILARSLLSWVIREPTHPVMAFLIGITEPILAPLRRILPTVGFLDLPPMVAIIILIILHRLLVPALA
jgi:YggT family protein